MILFRFYHKLGNYDKLYNKRKLKKFMMFVKLLNFITKCFQNLIFIVVNFFFSQTFKSLFFKFKITDMKKKLLTVRLKIKSLIRYLLS